MAPRSETPAARAEDSRSRTLIVLGADRDPAQRSGAPVDAIADVLRGLGADVSELDLFAAPHEVLERAPRAVFVDAMDRLDYALLVGKALRREDEAHAAPLILAIPERLVAQLEPRSVFDDFVVAPYFPAEVYARLRRAEWHASEFVSEEHIKLGDLYVDIAAHAVTLGGRPIALTHKEYQLLLFLLGSGGRVHSREAILRKVWGARYEGGARTVDVHVRRLRAKLEDSLPLVTVRGAGYKIGKP